MFLEGFHEKFPNKIVEQLSEGIFVGIPRKINQ